MKKFISILLRIIKAPLLVILGFKILQNTIGLIGERDVLINAWNIAPEAVLFSLVIQGVVITILVGILTLVNYGINKTNGISKLKFLAF